MAWTEEENDKLKMHIPKKAKGLTLGPVGEHFRRDLGLPEATVDKVVTGIDLPDPTRVAARCAAVSAAARLWEGGLHRDIDIEEFLGTAVDIEEWIYRP